MVEFRYIDGAVYIFENSKAQRVKVGMTVNDPIDRLCDVNDMWIERKVTCQICGLRLVNIGGHVPHHKTNITQHMVAVTIFGPAYLISLKRDAKHSISN